MKKIYYYISIILLLFFTQKARAQNVDGDGLATFITNDTIVKCEGDLMINIVSCFVSQLGFGLDSAIVTTINPFEIEIDLSYNRLSLGTFCHDTTFVFSSLPSGNYKFIVKSSVSDGFGGGVPSLLAEDEDSVFIAVNRLNSIFNPFIENEVLCKDGSLIDFLNLDAGASFSDYSWSDGSKGRYLLIEREGQYHVTVTDSLGCLYADSISIVNDCVTSIYVPNSFTPNNDGLNDVFRAYGKEIEFDEMQVFNRWGELIFKTENIEIGWKGEDSPVGIYLYKILYKDSDYVDQQIMGSISLIR